MPHGLGGNGGAELLEPWAGLCMRGSVSRSRGGPVDVTGDSETNMEAKMVVRKWVLGQGG